MIALDALDGRLDVRVTERLDEFRVRYSGQLNASELRSFVLKVCQFVQSSIVERDQCSIRVEHADEPIAIDFSSMAACAVSLVGLDASDDDVYEASVEITVEKNVEAGVLSLYSVDAFSRYLDTGPLADVARTLAMKLSGTLLLECQLGIVRGGTRTIRFAPKGEPGSFDPVEQTSRAQMLGLFRDSGHTDLKLDPLTPADVGMRERTGVDHVDRFFDRLSALVAVTFLANHTSMVDGNIHYRMVGYRVMDGTASVDALAGATPALIQIAQWCYADGGQSDKVGLARNVISIHVNQLGELDSKPEVWHALLSNYQIYLKQNVESYLALKGRLSDMLMDASARTQTLAGNALDAVRNGLFALLTFLVTVVVVNAVKDMSVEAVFSLPYLVIAFITCLLLSVWVGAAMWHALREYDTGAQSLEAVVAENYGTMLSARELTDALVPAAKRNRAYLLGHLRRHAQAWAGIVTILLISLSLGHLWMMSVKKANSMPPASSSVPVGPVNIRAAMTPPPNEPSVSKQAQGGRAPHPRSNESPPPAPSKSAGLPAERR